MKRRVIVTALLSLLCSTTAFAAPKTMPDGTEFDAELYASLYPDIVAVYGTDGDLLYQHYIHFGKAEGRIAIQGTAAQSTAEQGAAGQGTATGKWPSGVVTSSSTDEEITARIEALKNGTISGGCTEEEIREKLLALKERYPEGTVVGTCSEFADKVVADVFGTLFLIDSEGNPHSNPDHVAMWSTSTFVPDQIRVGDVIHLKMDGMDHVAVVLGHDDKGMNLLEANRGNDKAVHWGRFIGYNYDMAVRRVDHFLY